MVIVIKIFGQPVEDVCELEKARYIFDYQGRIVLVEGQRVGSFEELVSFAARPRFRGRDSLEVVLIPALAGG